MVISYYDVINFKENKELFSVLHFIFLKINSLFSLISIAQRELLKTKNGKSIQMNQFSVRVTSTGKSSNFLEDIKNLVFQNNQK